MDIRSEKIDGWQKLAWDAWKRCYEKELRMGFGLQIRQYWSRLAPLFELAYEGAMSENNVKKAVQVIDSLKSRTALTWGEMDQFLSGQMSGRAEEIREHRKKYYFIEAQANMGIYAPDYSEMRRKLLKKGVPKKSGAVSFDAIPDRWAAIHFYLKDEHQGVALAGINPSDGSSDVNWHFYPIDMTPVWFCYKRWSEVYRKSDPKHKSSKLLDELCQSIGNEMPFLFDLAEKVKGIIFVPHGFTHQLPLHAARGDGGEYLFQQVCCTYLPAWSLISPDILNQGCASGGNYCFRYFAEEKEESYLRDIFDSGPWNQKIDGADIVALSSLNGQKPPKWLSILPI